MTVPNVLTMTRIVMIPVLILIFYLPVPWAHGLAAAIFLIASFTDWLDGFVARKFKQGTRFGAFLDPVADKLLVACILLLLVGSCDRGYITLPAIVIVSREIMISALREWMAEIGDSESVSVSYIAKVKTTVQMISLTLLLAFKPAFAMSMTAVLGILGMVLLYVAAVLTIWSMVVYLMAAWPKVHEKSA